MKSIFSKPKDFRILRNSFFYFFPRPMKSSNEKSPNQMSLSVRSLSTRLLKFTAFFPTISHAIKCLPVNFHRPKSPPIMFLLGEKSPPPFYNVTKGLFYHFSLILFLNPTKSLPTGYYTYYFTL